MFHGHEGESVPSEIEDHHALFCCESSELNGYYSITKTGVIPESATDFTEALLWRPAREDGGLSLGALPPRHGLCRFPCVYEQE